MGEILRKYVATAVLLGIVGAYFWYWLRLGETLERKSSTNVAWWIVPTLIGVIGGACTFAYDRNRSLRRFVVGLPLFTLIYLVLHHSPLIVLFLALATGSRM